MSSSFLVVKSLSASLAQDSKVSERINKSWEEGEECVSLAYECHNDWQEIQCKETVKFLVSCFCFLPFRRKTSAERSPSSLAHLLHRTSF
jgi:hypothetical protein